MNDLSSLLFLLLRKSPLLLVLMGGLVFAVVRWKRHPRTSLFASIGIGLYVIEIFVMSIVYYILPSVLVGMHIFMSNRVFTVIQVVDDFVYGGILILLVAAAFSERAPKSVINI
jgi:hypothetical protein